MKQYALLFVFIINTLNSMNHSDRMHIELHDRSFADFVETYNLSIQNRSVFHIGCSTGKNSVKFAQKASRVHAFDTKEDCINIAKNEHKKLKNIIFEHYSTLFNHPRCCDVAIIDYTVIDDYTNTNEKIKALLKCVNQHVSQNGEIFISVITSDNRFHPNIITAMKMAPNLQEIMPDMTQDDIVNYIIPPYPSTQEVLTMLNETGFELIANKQDEVVIAITQKNLCSAYRNIIRQNPMIRYIQDPSAQRELTELFIQSYLSTFNNTNGYLFEPMITTIFHARKK